MSSKIIAIIGGGPCGLMAAETLAEAGCAVTVYDRMASPARKLLIAGRGGLNLTHSEPLDALIARYGKASAWLAPHIHSFTPEMLRAWCEGLGQETFVGSSGRVFPRSMKAVLLLRAWLLRLEKLGVRYAPKHCWTGWDGQSLTFTDGGGKTVLVNADATLLALGGASWPRLGSDGGWVSVLGACGVAIAPLLPANCGFVVPWSEHFSTRFAGEALKPVALSHQGVVRQGEAMITAQGLEGGVVYALCGAMREAIAREGRCDITLDLRPAMTVEALALKLQQTPRGSQSLSGYLRKAGFSALAIGLLHEKGKVEDTTPMALASLLKSLPFTLTATSGMARAISSAGGIVREALTDDFMLRDKAGVFAAGEMLDWEAPTGGYLLQGCFSTGVAAAKGMLRYLDCEAHD